MTYILVDIRMWQTSRSKTTNLVFKTVWYYNSVYVAIKQQKANTMWIGQFELRSRSTFFVALTISIHVIYVWNTKLKAQI